MMERLREIVAPSIDAPSIGGFANISMWFGEPDRHVRPLHVVHRRSNRVFGSPDRGEVLRNVVDQLDSFAPLPDGLIRLDARVLVGAGGVVLVCSSFDRTVKQWERVAGHPTWTAQWSRFAVVDPATAEAVLLPSAVDLDLAALRGLDQLYPTSSVGPPPSPRRVPVHAVVIFRRDDDGAPVGSRAGELLNFSQLAAPRGEPIDGRYLDALARFHAGVRVVRASSCSRDLLERLLESVESAGVGGSAT